MHKLQQIFILSKLLSLAFMYYYASFTKIFEDNTKIYWCYGSFTSDNKYEFLIITICSSIIPVFIFMLIFLNYKILLNKD